MSATRKNHTHYVIHQKLTQTCATGEFTHDIHVAVKANSKSGRRWYLKKAESAPAAWLECLAQELMRVHRKKDSQPKTRLLVDESGLTCVLSKEVIQAEVLPANYYSSPEYAYELGQIFALNIYLMEVDLKPEHILLANIEEQIVPAKIDSGACFASFVGMGNASQLNISASLLNRLPNVNSAHYAAHNWMRSIIQGNQAIGANGIYQYLDLKAFRAGLCRAILQICIFPDNYIERLASVYPMHAPIKDGALDLLSNRSEQLACSAMQNHWFRAYITSSKAQEDMMSFASQISEVKMSDKEKLVESPEQLTNVLQQRFTELHAEAININEIFSAAENFIEDLRVFVNENHIELGAAAAGYLAILSTPFEFGALDCSQKLQRYAKVQLQRFPFMQSDMAIALHEAVFDLLENADDAIKQLEELKASQLMRSLFKANKV